MALCAERDPGRIEHSNEASALKMGSSRRTGEVFLRRCRRSARTLASGLPWWAMEIHRLDPDEVKRFRAIRLRALRDSPAAFGTGYREAMGWSPGAWEELFGGLVVFVARQQGRDVGMVRVAADHEVRNAARLGSLWVDPDARCAGVGTALIAVAIEWARSGGFGELLLDVADENAAAADSYARMGFEPTGRTSRFPPPREHLGKHELGRKLQPA